MGGINQKVDYYFNLLISTLNNFDRDSVKKFVDLVLEVYDKGNTIFVFGNGGSGANASHLCGDYIKDLSIGLDKKFKVVCLNDNSTSLTAYANDISYEDIFIGPLKNFLKKGDLVIGISGSGNSANVVKALVYANSIGAKTVAFCGFSGGEIKKVANLSLHAEVNNMEVSEDVHLILHHCVKTIIMGILKNSLEK